MNLMHWIRANYILIILILISCIFHWIWIFNKDYITYGDARIYTNPTQLELSKNALYIYNTSTNTGSIELSGGTKLMEFIHGTLAALGIYYPISFRIIYLYPYILLAPISIYYYSKKYLKSNIAVFIACIFSLFNTYTLILQTAGVLMLLANMFARFGLLFYHKFFFERKTYPSFFILVLSLYLSSIYDFRIFYILCGVTSLYILSLIIFFKHSWRDFLYHFLAIILVFLLNFHWLLSLSLMQQLSSNELFARGLFGGSYFDLLSSMTLFHRFWTGYQPAAFVNQPIPAQFWLTPMILLGGFYFSRNDKKRYFIIILALLSIFLTKQQDQPFSNVYEWMYKHIPGFNAFREASKFYFLSTISFSILVGYFVDGIRSHKKINQKIKIAIYAALIMIFLWNGRSLLTLKIRTLFIPRYMPVEYQNLNDFIVNKSENNYRALWLPINSKWGVYLNQKPAISMVFVSQSLYNLREHDGYIESDSPKNSVGLLLKQSYSQNILNRLNIRYVIVPMQDKENEDDFFFDYGKDRLYYKNLVNDLHYMKKIDIKTEGIDLYENPSSYPKIYLTDSQESIDNIVPIQAVRFEYINPTEYKLELPELSIATYLNFAEGFSPNWKLFHKDEGGNFVQLDAENNENDLHLNTFYMKPAHAQTIYLKFDSQKYYTYGLYVSIGTFVVLMSILIAVYAKKRQAAALKTKQLCF